MQRIPQLFGNYEAASFIDSGNGITIHNGTSSTRIDVLS